MSVASVPRRHGAARPIVARVAAIVALAVVAVAVVGVWGRLPFVAESNPLGAMLPDAFRYQQQRSLSCEYASVHIATTMTGQPVSEYEIEALVTRDENSHVGYRGNIHGEWGNTTDYGVYNEPLQAALATQGITSDAFYADGDRSALTGALDAGRPVIVWLAMRGDVNSFDAWDANGDRFQLTQWMHVMVAYGYDDTNVYLSDPGTAVWREYTWAEFMAMWGVMDGMGLSVSPA